MKTFPCIHRIECVPQAMSEVGIVELKPMPIFFFKDLDSGNRHDTFLRFIESDRWKGLKIKAAMKTRAAEVLMTY